jgi:hypothetical protein
MANHLVYHYDRPIKNTDPQSVQFITLFLEVHNYVAPFTSLGKLHEFVAEKTNFLS